MKSKLILLFALLFISAAFSWATRPDPTGSGETHTTAGKKGGAQSDGGLGGFFGPGGGFNIPGFGSGWGNGIPGGYGVGYGGPNGGYSKGGVVRPTVVCKDRGPCYKKKVTCPAKCFSSFSGHGKGSGYGGGGGGCTIDCKKSCTAYC